MRACGHPAWLATKTAFNSCARGSHRVIGRGGRWETHSTAVQCIDQCGCHGIVLDAIHDDGELGSGGGRGVVRHDSLAVLVFGLNSFHETIFLGCMFGISFDPFKERWD